MIRRTILLVIISAFTACLCLSQNRDDLRIWQQFTQILKVGQFPAEKIRPHAQLGDEYRQILRGYLDSVRTHAVAEDWRAVPEVIRTDHRIQYIVPWSTGGQKVSYCFSFLIEESEWYFQHLESIFIRLDKIPQLPTSNFPDISEEQKHWAREELNWSFVLLNVYLPAAKEKGDEYALNLLKDGGGYFVGAKTWVPFAPPHKAFVLYLCWELAKLRGNSVTLVRLDDAEAIVELETHFFALYSVASHLKRRISIDGYKRIFETIWHDRASHAGWKLDVQYSADYKVTFLFKRSI